jgi:hypothetical protein
VAVLEAASVNTLLFPVVLLGLKLAVTPVGSPLALSVTALVKLVRVMLIVLVPLVPRLTVRLEGLGASAKFGVAVWLTVSAIVVVRVRPPPVPVIVTVTGPPSVAVLEAASVSVLLLPVVLLGLKVAVTPVGKPLALNVTALVKLVRVMLIVLVPLVPRFIVRLEGLAASAKFGVAG